MPKNHIYLCKTPYECPDLVSLLLHEVFTHYYQKEKQTHFLADTERSSGDWPFAKSPFNHRASLVWKPGGLCQHRRQSNSREKEAAVLFPSLTNHRAVLSPMTVASW